MMNDEITPGWPLRIWHAFERLCSDIAYLFKPNKLFVYSWMEYKGSKMLNNNWGDDINKYFFESISDFKIQNLSPSLFYKLFPIKGYSCIGSIIGIFSTKKYEVWGSGLIERNKEIKNPPLKVHSVRGPLTREELIKKGIACPEIYGDPALLISRYYRKLVDKTYTWGIIPHYTDENNPALIDFCDKHPEVLLIRMQGYNDWHEIPDKIMSCRHIISSSLHGLIMADSYGVPNAWVRFSDAITGGDFKYLDYFQSVGRKINGPYYINTRQDLERIIIEDATSRAHDINFRSIFEACPFKDKLKDYNELIPKLPNYQTRTEKDDNYCSNYYIRTEDELDKKLMELEALENAFLFRGVNDASFKLFSSSQRHWMQVSDRMISLGTRDYYEAINRLLSITRRNPEVSSYQKKQNYSENDFYLLALMQHFGVPAPMVDFSHSMRKALFFAVDRIKEWDDHGTDTLDDYISLYYVNKNIDWIHSSVQEIMKSAGRQVDDLVAFHNQVDPNSPIDTVDVQRQFQELTYSQFVPDGSFHSVKFIPVNGPEVGVTSVKIHSLNFSCGYMISNDRILAQDGMFILNNTIDQPLEEVVNRQVGGKIFCCLNIHKNLAQYIRNKYLLPYNLTHEIVYCENDDDVMKLQKAMDML